MDERNRNDEMIGRSNEVLLAMPDKVPTRISRLVRARRKRCGIAEAEQGKRDTRLGKPLAGQVGCQKQAMKEGLEWR